MMYQKDKIEFLKATKKDCEFLFKLRNDPIVRANSINSEKINFEDHKGWFFKNIKNPTRKIFVVMLNNTRIGQIRFDEENSFKSAEISISISQKNRGRGLGTVILQKGCQLGFSIFGYNSITAKIKKCNIASIKAFSRSGFIEKKQENGLLTMELSKKIKKGIKLWTTDTYLFSKAKELFNKGYIEFVEIYIVPGTFDISIKKIKNLDMPIILHMPHSRHNFNPGDRSLLVSNINIFNEVKKFAKELGQPQIIIHPESGNIKDSLGFISRINYNDLLIENMPKEGMNGEKCIGYLPEEIKLYLDKGCGFCLDLGHAYKAAISLHKDPKKFIKEFLKLKPSIFHLSDGNIDKELDEHLNLGEGDFDLSFLKNCIQKSESRMVTLETPRIDGLKNDIKNINFFKNI